MKYIPYKPQTVYIAEDAQNYKSTKQIIENIDYTEPVVIDDLQKIDKGSLKNALVLAKQKGNFFKRCPGTSKYICCGYKILNLVNNCEIGCSYCILQNYINCPYILVYVNIEDMFTELDNVFYSHPNHHFRIGTGELADSLSTDHLTGYSQQLVQYFAEKKNAIIELKTKSIQIENFINLDHKGRTVVSWSLNTPSIIASEESNAPTLEERLAAAKKCQAAGFKIGFHFDPMIYYDNWEQEYQYTVDQIFNYIDPRGIIWISLGALRYPPQLDNIIRENHPETNIVYGELVPGFDGKLRYFKPFRIEMFKKMNQWIKQYDNRIFIYLCMESVEVYQTALEWNPKSNANLSRMMNNLIKDSPDPPSY